MAARRKTQLEKDQVFTGDSIQSLLNERSKTHGSFVDNGRIMQALKNQARKGVNWEILLPHQAEAIDMILHKIGRILSGNPDELEHWKDISGYATLVQNIIETGKSHL